MDDPFLVPNSTSEDEILESVEIPVNDVFPERVWRQASVLQVTAAVACFSCSYGMLMPILPAIKRRFFFETTDCGDACDALAAEVSGGVDSVSAFIGVVVLPVLGYWSDKVGRKPPLVVIAILNLLPALALFLYASMQWSLYVYFGANMLQLGSKNSVGIVNAVMADCSSKEARQRAFAGIVFISIAAFSLMPSLGISLGEKFGEVALIGLVVIINVLGVIMALLFTETLHTCPADEELTLTPAQRELQMEEGDAVAPVEFPAWNFCRWPQVTNLRLACIISMLSMFSMSGMAEIVLFYVHTYLQFSLRQNANMLLCIGISSTLLQLFLTVSRKSIDDKTLVLSGLAANFVHLVGFSLATNAAMMYAAELMSGLSTITPLGLQSMVSKRADEAQQGRVLGIISSVSTLAGVFAPAFFGFVFGIFQKQFPVAPFVVGAMLTSIAFFFALKLKR